jgi:hypothetical protein
MRFRAGQKQPDAAFTLGLRIAGALALLTAISMPAQAQRTIVVSNILELYKEVNDTANAGAKVVIAPGTYFLNHTFDHGGRLELQENMSLTGQIADPTAVVIDASDLQSTTTTTGPVRIGRGSNALEWLTIQNDLAGAGVIETDLPPTFLPTRIRVAHVIVQGGQRGIDFRAGPAFSGKTVSRKAWTAW